MSDFMLDMIRGAQVEPKAYGARAPDANVPWPDKLAPRALSMSPPMAGAPLPECDVVVVTWTSGEALTLASLLAGTVLADWHPYTSNVESFIPMVTGHRAPFADNSAEMKRYYHTLGLYSMFQIGDARCIAFKSGLHMAYDGPAMPIIDLWQQIARETKAKLIITTGTGGGIGADIALGDVVVARHAKFHLTWGLRGKPFADDVYECSALDLSSALKLATPRLLNPNGGKLAPPRTPKIWCDSKSDIVTTDVFAFDDSSDHFGLQGLGRCCDMGDATLGLALSRMVGAAPKWVAIRNASDPQIHNPKPGTSEGLTAAKQEAEKIYSSYQCVTTAGSVIATWAVIAAEFGGS